MRVTRSNLILAVAALLPCALPGQESVTRESVIERVGVQAALTEAGLVGGAIRIVISPDVAHPDDAPAGRTRGARAPSRNAYLRDAFDAALKTRDDVVRCAAGRCELRDADAIVTLSDPAVSGDRATITVTLERSSGPRLVYATNRFHLRRSGGIWRVDRVEQLGIA